jgi:hypothetical protein
MAELHAVRCAAFEVEMGWQEEASRERMLITILPGLFYEPVNYGGSGSEPGVQDIAECISASPEAPDFARVA